MFRKLREAGLSDDVRSLLEKVWAQTVKVGRFLYQVGKVIVYEFLRFVRKHPGLAGGLVAASALTVAVSRVPVVGPFLAKPLFAISFGILGTMGLVLDAEKKRRTLIQEFIAVLKDFVELCRSIIRAILPPKPKWSSGEEGWDAGGLLPAIA